MRLVILALVTLLVVPSCRSAAPPPARVEAKADGGEATIELTSLQIQNGQVRWQRLLPGGVRPRLRVAASLVADAQKIAEVGTRVAGRIASIDVQLGDRVHRGQALLHVDTVEVHKVTLEYLTAGANTRQKRDAVERQRKLVAERVGAPADLQRAEAEQSAALAELKEAEEHLHYLGLSDRNIAKISDTAEHGAAKSTVPSPIDGRVVALSASLGQVVGGTENLVTVADTDPLWAVVRLYDRDATRVAVGAALELALGEADAPPVRSTVSFVSDVVDPISRTVEARAKLDNPNGSLRPGLTTTAYLELRGHPNALCVPAEALQPYAGAPTVFVRVGERAFRPQPVEIEPEQGGVVCLRGGVRPEDDVVVHGAFAVRGEADRPPLGE